MSQRTWDRLHQPMKTSQIVPQGTASSHSDNACACLLRRQQVVLSKQGHHGLIIRRTSCTYTPERVMAPCAAPMIDHAIKMRAVCPVWGFL